MTQNKELVVRGFKLAGVELVRDNPDDVECVLSACLNGQVRRSGLGQVLQGEGQKKDIEWKTDDVGSLGWIVSASEFKRIQIHEPRLRVDVLVQGEIVGFTHFDLRNVDYEHGSSVTEWRPIVTRGGDSKDGPKVQFMVTTRPVQHTVVEEDQMFDDELVLFEKHMENVGVVLGNESILIGKGGDMEMTLYITLRHTSGMGAVLLNDAVIKNTEYWLSYNIFGVTVETGRFMSAKHATFAPIKDSFKVQGNISQVAQFLQDNPVRIYLCQGTKSGESNVVASSLMSFDTLFSNGLDFAQSSSNCAFPFQQQSPYSFLGADNPSIAVLLELHIEGTLPQTVGGAPEQIPKATQENEPVDNDQSTTSNETSSGCYFRFGLCDVELDPFEDEDDTNPVVYVRLASLKEDRRSNLSKPFKRDDYGQLETVPVENVSMVVDQEQVIQVECVDPHGKVCATGRISMPWIDTDKLSIELISARDGATVVGNVRVGIKEISEEEYQSLLSPPSPKKPGSPTAHGIHTGPPVLSENVHTYRMTIDLRSVKGLTDTYNVYLQYSYPLFGALRATQTRPPILMDRFSERVIPHGLRLFQFDTSPKQLECVTQTEPLVVEMWHKDRYMVDKRLGFCAVPLRKLLESRPYYQWAGQTFATHRALELYREKYFKLPAKSSINLATERRKIERLEKQLSLPVVQVHGLETDLTICSYGENGSSRVKRIATVHCACTLENMGPCKPGSPKKKPVPATPVISPQHKAEREEQEVVTSSNGDDTASDHGAPDVPNQEFEDKCDDPDQGDESVAEDLAQELANAWGRFEAWKDAETQKWNVEMRTKLSVRMSELEQEWARREHERASALKLAQEQFKQLEERMHRTITDAERRERAVARLESELQRSAEQRMADLEVLNRRAREETEHQVNLHKNKSFALEGEVKRLRQALEQSEKRYRKVEDDFAEFREKVRKSPEAALQREIAQLQGTNAELTGRIDQEKEKTAIELLAKESLKAQLVQAARELERMRKAETHKAERQLDKLRLEYLAREERFVLDGDRQQLQEMRDELRELRSVTLRKPYTRPPSSPPEDTVRQPVEREVDDEKLQRLENEKRDLMQTGLYDETHPIIE
eukprot:CAMPEP_0203765078 /NCGR_PEP_ID=MMETSP0098-20131031/18216_1 /ASSEMBLY_ACC=CAM_ASM_000208 /TAXON_ID=96639 /ORGANISM=" , Strain NY0313808BC1" /LENGTH=1112 /DNA_ID=CAMNT_0050661297 /DNA_START=206 /DNA_END=3541 /DNA_ORIENTATION=+